MSDAAFRYYIPSFLTLCIEEYDRVEDLSQTTVSAISYAHDPVFANKQPTRFDRFTSAQKRAIAAFLRYLSEQHAVDFPSWPFEATIEYWEGAAAGDA